MLDVAVKHVFEDDAKQRAANAAMSRTYVLVILCWKAWRCPAYKQGSHARQEANMHTILMYTRALAAQPAFILSLSFAILCVGLHLILEKGLLIGAGLQRRARRPFKKTGAPSGAACNII